MANTEYHTVPTKSDATDSDEEVVWNTGNLVSFDSSIWPNFGNTSELKQSTNWGVNRKSNKYIYNADSYYMGGNNGKSHEANYVQESNKSGYRPSMANLKGFSIKAKQDSTAGHGIYLKNVCISMTNDTGGNQKIWASGDQSRKDNYNWNRYSFNFSASDIASMTPYYFDRIWIRLSTSGGTGTRETYVTLGALKLKWDVGPSNARWVVGKRLTSPYIRGEQIQEK